MKNNIRCLICTIIPDKLIKQFNASQASNNFCNNLVEYVDFDCVYSLWPPSYKLNSDFIDDNNLIRHINNKGTNTLSTIYSYIVNSIFLACNAKSHSSIWFYNICNSNLLTYLILRYIFRKKIFIILADHTPGKKISIQHLIEYLLKSASGLISLSSRTQITNKNKINIAGILPSNKISSIIKAPTSKNFLFSGSLSSVTGFEMAIDVFSNIPNAQLYISGNGKFPSEYAKYENIHFLGMLDYQNYLELFSKIDICLNFRNPYLPENNNNFPSKVLEYFSKNKVVLSTIDYPELVDFKYIKVPFNKKDIINNINYILSNNIDLKCYQDNRQALKNNFSEIKWQEAIINIEKHIL